MAKAGEELAGVELQFFEYFPGPFSRDYGKQALQKFDQFAFFHASFDHRLLEVFKVSR